MEINWQFPYKSECKQCLTFHDALIRNLEAVNFWKTKFEEQEKRYQKVCSELLNFEDSNKHLRKMRMKKGSKYVAI